MVDFVRTTRECTFMQPYDIIMLVVLAAATLFGAIKGFAWQVASLASIIVSYFVANYFRNDVAKMINAEPPWNMFLAMLLLYFGSSLVIWLLFRMISKSIDKIKLKEFDRQLGAGFGLLKGAVLCCVITMFAMTLLGPSQQQAIAQSKSGYYIGKTLSQAGAILPKEVVQVIGPYIDRVNQQLEQGRDPNFVPPPNNGTLNPNLDAWGRALDSKMSDLSRDLFPGTPNGAGQGGAGQGGAGPTGSGQGGILERFFPPRNTSGGNNPATHNPNSVPSGWPVSSPNPNTLPPANNSNWPNNAPLLPR
ncbi:MAG: CvpA family protein [Planctomycetota bacterium]